MEIRDTVFPLGDFGPNGALRERSFSLDDPLIGMRPCCRVSLRWPAALEGFQFSVVGDW